MAYFISGILVGIFIGTIITLILNSNQCTYINTANKDSCCDKFSPWFEVVEITHAIDTNGKAIARYCIEARFFNKEDNRDFTIKRLCFYDELHKYKLNDIIRLQKKE